MILKPLWVALWLHFASLLLREVEGGVHALGFRPNKQHPFARCGCVLYKPAPDPAVLDNYRPVSNRSFMGKVIERVVAKQLQQILEEMDSLP